MTAATDEKRAAWVRRFGPPRSTPAQIRRTLNRKRKGDWRIAACDQCGVKAECMATCNPPYWIAWGGADPNIVCCSAECMAEWERTHANVVAFANEQYLAVLGGRS